MLALKVFIVFVAVFGQLVSLTAYAELPSYLPTGPDQSAIKWPFFTQPAAKITGFTLWNTKTNLAVRSLQNGDIIDTAVTPEFTIIASTFPEQIGGVIFGY
jgi:hypothetical protein